MIVKVDENEVEKKSPSIDGEDQMSVKSSSELAPLKNTAQFSGKPPPDVHPLAVKLGKREWENEVARNILVLYKANMNAQRKLMEEPSRISSKTSGHRICPLLSMKKTPEVLVSLVEAAN